jgi:hypothetical protein
VVDIDVSHDSASLDDGHLARLCMAAPGRSVGTYTLHRFALHLRASTKVEDDVVYLHEVHHSALNDATAWGTLLHLYGRLPTSYGSVFDQLLDSCRTLHESFATFLSVEIAGEHHSGSLDVLDGYPDYRRLYHQVDAFVGGTAGTHRRQMVVNAAARLCMQTGALATFCRDGLSVFDLSRVRQVDQPDWRWQWLRGVGEALLPPAVQLADARVLQAYGPPALPAGDLADATDAAFDDAWELWERTVYDSMRAALSRLGARTLAFNGHQEDTVAAIALVRQTYADIQLRPEPADDERPSDTVAMASIVEMVRLTLAPQDRWAADLAPLPPASLVDHHHVIDGERVMIVDVRPAGRLRHLFRWPGDVPPGSFTTAGPVAAVRIIGDDGHDGSVILHAPLSTVDDLLALRAAWQGQGRFIGVISTSSLVDTAWQEAWMPALRQAGPVVILVDVELDRFLPRLARSSSAVRLATIQVNDRARPYAALLLTPDDGRTLVLAVFDPLTIELLRRLAHDLLGDVVDTSPHFFEPVRATVTAALTHILATESFLSLDGLRADPS